MITSMSQSELYNTLIGHYAHNGKMISLGEEGLPGAEKITVADCAPLNPDMKQSGDIPSSMVLGDRFERSGEDKIVFSEISSGYEISDAINFDCNNIRTEMESGFTNGIPTKERIAEYFGNIAKRLDTAYSEGKFTKEEYDELNVYLEEQLERKVTLTERRAAFYAWGQRRGSLSPSAAGETIRRQQSMTPEQWREERDSIIDELVEKYYKIDRESLWEMFNAVRYGGNENEN